MRGKLEKIFWNLKLFWKWTYSELSWEDHKHTELNKYTERNKNILRSKRKEFKVPPDTFSVNSTENYKEFDKAFLFLADQPNVNRKVIEKLISSSDETRDILVPQYRYRIGYPICIPKNYWDKLSLSGTNIELETGQETLDPLSYIKISGMSMKKLWFQYLNPVDIDEEKDR